MNRLLLALLIVCSNLTPASVSFCQTVGPLVVDSSDSFTPNTLAGHPARPDISSFLVTPEFDVILMRWQVPTYIPCLMRVTHDGVLLDTIPVPVNAGLQAGAADWFSPYYLYWYDQSIWVVGPKQGNLTWLYRRYTSNLELLDSTPGIWPGPKDYHDAKLSGNLLWVTDFKPSLFDMAAQQFVFRDSAVIPSSWRGSIRMPIDSGMFCVDQKSSTATFYTRFMRNDGSLSSLDSTTPATLYQGNLSRLHGVPLSPTTLLVWYRNVTGLDTVNLCYFTVELSGACSDVQVVQLSHALDGFEEMNNGIQLAKKPDSAHVSASSRKQPHIPASNP